MLLPVIAAWAGTVPIGQVRINVVIKDLLREDPKLKDYITVLPLAPDATLADAKDLLDKIPNVSISWLHKTELRMA